MLILCDTVLLRINSGTWNDMGHPCYDVISVCIKTAAKCCVLVKSASCLNSCFFNIEYILSHFFGLDLCKVKRSIRSGYFVMLPRGRDYIRYQFGIYVTDIATSMHLNYLLIDNNGS